MNAIYLCDDDHEWIKKMESYIAAYQVQSNWLLEIMYAACSPEKLLRFLREHKPASGIYFLDIEFKSSMDGLELGAEIRKMDPSASLVYVTTHDELAMETLRYRLMALDYIVKDQDCIRDQICQVLSCLEKRYKTALSRTLGKLQVKTGDGFYFLLFEEIYYIEAQHGTHKTLIHARDKIIAVSRPLSEMEAELGDVFFMCRRGCLVNLDHVKQVRLRKLDLLLDSGESICCSTRAISSLARRLRKE